MMLALGIHYLNGWAMAAADGAKKERAEWPPHPDRVFMALAAAWFETGEEPDEGDALRWLERLEPPSIFASDAGFRYASGDDVPPLSFVPVNDTASPIFKKGNKEKSAQVMGSFSIGRVRKERRFPIAVPHDPVVHLVWRNADAGSRRGALERLARKVTHVGHPASFVQIWLEDVPPAPNWIPTDGQTAHRLRVFGPERLQYLKTRYNRDNVVAYADLQARISEAKGKKKKKLQEEMGERFKSRQPISLRPEPARWQGYDRPPKAPSPETASSVFDPRLTVLALSGKRLSLPATLKLTETLRGAILAACPDPIPEWVSGHTLDGKPSANPHLALLPLPFSGHEHADGRLMGVALALPKGIDAPQAAHCLGPLLHDEHGLSKRNKLFAGQWLECSVELETREMPPTSLRTEVWTQPSRTWASVTPVVLDRHFDGKDKWERAAEIVKDACERIGLPRPREVLLHPVSLVEGVPHAREFPHLARKKDGGRMHHSHAVIVFEAEVTGPVVVGAGRFRGYGLCRPIYKGGGA